MEMMTEFLGNWGERPESAVLRWKNDITAAKELCYPKEVVRKIEDESDPYKRQRMLCDARHKYL